MKEVCESNGVAEKLCDGISAGSTGSDGIISEVARWQSTQCVQVPLLVVSAVASASWHGIDEVTVTDASLCEAAAPPESGMTTAIAPDKGNQSIMKTSISLWKKLMDIRQAYREKVPSLQMLSFTIRYNSQTLALAWLPEHFQPESSASG